MLRMLEAVRAKLPGQRRKAKNIRLYACAARVFIEANGVTAGLETLVLADGGCTLLLEPFIALIKTYGAKEHLTIQADKRALRLFGTVFPITDYTRQVSPPGHFRVFPVTDLNVTNGGETTSETETRERAGISRTPAMHGLGPPGKAKERPRREPLRPEPAPEGTTYEDEYPVISCLAGTMQKLIRVLCLLDQVTPRMIIGLARALHAFNRLPTSTQGVDVFFTTYERLEIKDGYREVGFYVSISERAFELGDRIVGCEGGSKMESLIPAYSLRWPWSEKTPEENDWDGQEVVDWSKRLDEFLLHSDKERIAVAFQDKSEASCLD